MSKPMKRISRIVPVVACIVVSVLISSCATLVSSQSSQVAPNSSSGIFELSRQAEQAYQESRWIEAVRLYQQVVEKVPSDSSAWFRLGNTYAQQGAYERAIHAYESSLKHDSEQPKAWFNLSTAYLLNAQTAMRNSHERLREHDPARALIEERLRALEALVHGRFEEGVAPAVMRR